MTKTLPLPLLLIVALSQLSPALALAEQRIETDNQLLRQGLELYEELEYERAVEALSAALLEDNSREEQALIYQTLGTLYVFLDRQQQAELALGRLLCVNNDFQFDAYASPRIREVFDRVRQGWIDGGRPCQSQTQQQVVVQQRGPEVSIDHESPRSARPGDELELQLELQDPGELVRQVLVSYRTGGEQGFNEGAATQSGAGEYSLTLPGDVVQAPAAEYFIRALDAEGGTLARLGTERAPLRVPVQAPEGGRRSVARSWWLWTIVAVVVVGAGLGIGLGLGLQEDPPVDPPVDPPPPEEVPLTIFICDGETGGCFNQ